MGPAAIHRRRGRGGPLRGDPHRRLQGRLPQRAADLRRLCHPPDPAGRGPGGGAGAASGDGIVFSGIPDGRETVELLRVDEDGGNLTCLTCDVARTSEEPLLKAIAFPDGKRVLVRVGEHVSAGLPIAATPLNAPWHLRRHSSLSGEVVAVGADLVIEGAPAEPIPLLTREVLYTGMTRSTTSVTLVGDPALLERGVRTFDSAAGGLGGCPFAPGAPGNLATESLLAFLASRGLRTGVDPAAVSRATDLLRGHVPRLSRANTLPA